MRILIKNIKKLVQVERADTKLLKKGSEMDLLDCLDNSYLYIEGDKIADFGLMSELHEKSYNADNTIDADGKMVFPSYCDSHTHIVYAGSREREFVDKIKGMSYQEIARRGGGILNSAELLHNTSEDELYNQALIRVNEIIRTGTGAVEIKSGYGLSIDDELKMLRVIKRLSQNTPLTIKATFLGAHAVPSRYKDNPSEYIDEIITTMIPVIASEDLAEYIDVFCEDGFFSVEDTDRILNAGLKYGLRAKVHANQMGFSGGVQVGVKYNAISVDHLESTSEKEFNLLKDSDTMATLLPGATLFLDMAYAPARAMIKNGLAVALASNYNPGSCPSGDMKFMMFLACLKMKLSPEEAINATTINGAYAMGISDTHGSIAVGKKANIYITKPIPSYEFLAYSFNTPLIDKIILEGKEINL